MLNIKVVDGKPNLSLPKRDLETLNKSLAIIEQIGEFYPPLEDQVEAAYDPLAQIIDHIEGRLPATNPDAADAKLEGQAAK